jgi:hypothetical protein
MPASAFRRDVHHPTVAVRCSTTTHQHCFEHPRKITCCAGPAVALAAKRELL